MSKPEILGLGAIAGFTIFLGLPLGRLQRPAPRLRAGLNAGAIGVLVFLLFDVLSHANEPVEAALVAANDGGGTWARFLWLAAVFAAGFAVGLIGLVYYDRTLERGPAVPGAASLPGHARELAVMIAIGIGLHNFSEGLAIGQAAHAEKISLAVLLVVGFALHNATEGFGIVGPLAAAGERASWRWLALAGTIGGGPTFLGTIIGTRFSSEFVFVAFLALAGGAILYVVGELLVAGRRMSWEITLWGILAGFIAGLATELVVVAAGA